MSLNGSTGLAMVFGTALAIAGGVQLGQMSSASAPFHYSSASLEKRQAFLDKQASAIGKQIRRSLVSPSGIGPKFRLTDTNVDAARQRITFSIRVSGGRFLENRVGAVKRKAYRSYCPQYMQSQLGRNNITVVQRFVDRRDEALLSVALSQANCSGYTVARR